MQYRQNSQEFTHAASFRSRPASAQGHFDANRCSQSPFVSHGYRCGNDSRNLSLHVTPTHRTAHCCIVNIKDFRDPPHGVNSCSVIGDHGLAQQPPVTFHGGRRPAERALSGASGGIVPAGECGRLAAEAGVGDTAHENAAGIARGVLTSISGVVPSVAVPGWLAPQLPASTDRRDHSIH